MAESRKEIERKLGLDEYEIYPDSIGVMHFLPPWRCGTCDD
jgi:hypothetical protein